jgi:hypothetical protein
MITEVLARPAAPAVREERFFDVHHDSLRELFKALGREEEWRDTPEELLPYTQAKWVGQEHGNSTEKDQFTPEQSEAAQPILEKLGLIDEILPPVGVYEQVVIFGGFMRVNRERIGFVKELISEGKVRAEQIVFWSGERAREARDDAELERINFEELSGNSWISHQLRKPAGEQFATETELVRLAYHEHFLDTVLQDDDELRFTTSDYPDFVLLDCPAVQRPNGPTRPTIASCTREWLNRIPSRKAASILLVSGNPHIERNLRDVRQTISVMRPDIELTVCGPAASINASIQLHLGEVGRMLYMDTQSTTAL